MNAQQYTGIITKKSQLTKTVFHFIIQNEYPKELLFQPGQYATFFVDEKTRRQYSFCSAPDQSSFELVVDVSPMGPGSKYFLEKKEGERVEYLAPLGNFTLSQNPLKKIFVATGAGIAPFRSMLLNGIQNSEFRIQNCALYWGLRYEDDVYWDSEFKALFGQYTGFQYFLSLSKPSQNWHGLTGHITEHVFKNSPFAKASGDKEKNLQNCEFYLCGNSAMIKEIESKLSAQNVQNERIKKDMFY
ncbi:FAD-dependent oxidoreductase [Patescibacteria group bacterium]|nr:FAD-dependent oxidoreductase [Patescibacteria group bacterium]